ncbi:acyltransferase [bacterium]|nr:acyltransferase [bacterium]
MAVRRACTWLYLLVLRGYPPDRLARVAREHHIEAVRHRAWVLSGAFVVGEGTHFSWDIHVVVNNWGQLAARLGERVAIAPGVTFVAGSGPAYSHLAEMPGFAERHVQYAPIIVGDDTWIGAHVTILPGVTIGKCCVIGANTLVSQDIPDYAIAAVGRARIIGDVRKQASPPTQGA